MEEKKTSGYNQQNQALSLPADFVTRSEGLSSEAIILLINFFQINSSSKSKLKAIEVESFLRTLQPNHEIVGRQWYQALAEVIEEGLLISVVVPHPANLTYLLPGTPDGREVLLKAEQDPQILQGFVSIPDSQKVDRPNIYKLYEANIGPLTPLIADQLRADENLYPYDWIVDAVKEALQHNVRNWKYVSAILKNWQEKGREIKHEKDRNDLEEFRRLYREQKKRAGG